MKVEITPAQLKAIMEITDTVSGMLGVGSDFDIIEGKNIKLIDRFLKKNGFKRDFK